MIASRFLSVGLFLLAGIGAGAASAGEVPPSRIGRVTQIDGAASVRAPGGGEWSDAVVNDPVAAGMSVRTGGKARLQLGIGPDTIALSGATRIEIGRLDGTAAQIALPQGRIGVHLSQLDPGTSVEIDLPQAGAWLLAPGDYDIAAGDEKNAARIVALDGSARIVAEHGDQAIFSGATVEVSAGNIAKIDGGARDAFVAWWRPPRPGGKPQALRFVSPDMTGYDALDPNGSWEQAEGYGAVWYPGEIAEDWAPYRYGHWRWMAPWGWTWIDDMPWGFATSHYGRWARIGDRWAWVPGPRQEHPVYAPALVAFLGTAGVGLSYPDGNGPAVGWFPLAPGEVYWPGYTADPDTLQRLNPAEAGEAALIEPGAGGLPPAAIVRAEYRNRRYASVVPRPVFVAGRAVAPALIQLPVRRLENAPVLGGSPKIPPDTGRSPQQVASAAHALRRILAAPPAPAGHRSVAVLRGKRPAPRHATVAQAEHHGKSTHAGRSRPAATAAAAPHHNGARILHLAAAVHHRGRPR